VRADRRKQVTKTVADKLLKEMEQNGQIMGKATKKDGGGQWVFWALQVRASALYFIAH
jgi:26S proteasome regulatory subunit, ATPase 3, interacting protein